MNLSQMTGLEVLQAVADGEIPEASIAATMGLSQIVVEAGVASMTAVADDRHLNPFGAVHGGFVATVLDAVTGCAIHTLLPAKDTYGTVDLNVKMLRPPPRNTALIARAHVTHLSGQLGVAEGVLTDPQGRLIASASATCFIKRHSAEPSPNPHYGSTAPLSL